MARALKCPPPVLKSHPSGSSLTKGRIMSRLHPLCLWYRTVTGPDLSAVSFVDRNMRLSLGPPNVGKNGVYHLRPWCINSLCGFFTFLCPTYWHHCVMPDTESYLTSANRKWAWLSGREFHHTENSREECGVHWGRKAYECYGSLQINHYFQSLVNANFISKYIFGC